MIKSRNRRHSIELVVWILCVAIVVMNYNSILGGLGKAQDSASSDESPEVVQVFVGYMADAGNMMQAVAEKGILQSAFSVVKGEGVSIDADRGSDTVVVDAPTDTQSGNVGEWIEQAGGWVAGLWSTEADPVQALDDTELKRTLAHASSEFGELSRPVVTHVHNANKQDPQTPQAEN